VDAIGAAAAAPHKHNNQLVDEAERCLDREGTNINKRGSEEQAHHYLFIQNENKSEMCCRRRRHHQAQYTTINQRIASRII
jgi:hypothetical protein